MFVIVSYDIVDNSKRSKIADILLDYGKRVQKSVFECDLNDKNLQQMIKETLMYINPEEDSMKIYRLCSECFDKIENHGRQIMDDDVMIV
jgi:CRISPR-associated protein Cas2